MRRSTAWLHEVTSVVLTKPDPAVTAFTLDALGTQAMLHGDHAAAAELFLDAARIAITHSGARELILKAIEQAELAVRQGTPTRGSDETTSPQSSTDDGRGTTSDGTRLDFLFAHD